MKLNVFALLLLLSANCPCLADAPPRYKLTVLPLWLTNHDLPNITHFGGGISGTRVVGMFTVRDGKLTDQRAAVWQQGHGVHRLDMTPLVPPGPRPPLPASLQPTAVSRSGAIVGYSEYSFTGAWSGNGRNACLWQPGGSAKLVGYFPSASNALSGFPPDTDSAAVGINDKGDIIGNVTFNNHDKTPDNNPPANIAGTHAFLRCGGRIKLLWPGAVSSINNRDWVVGIWDNGEDPPSGQNRGVFWRNGHITLFNMQPVAVNDAGAIAGNIPLTDETGRACVWRQGHVTLLSKQVSHADALNNRGQVVGSVKRATLWQGGRTYDLNRCVPLPKGWVLENAVGINNSGWIIGEGSVYKTPKSKAATRTFTFLLTPR